MTTKPINSGLLLTISLPLFAIVASLTTAVVAFTRGDPTLPDEYHWEGLSLDRDFADAQRAADLNVQATLLLSPSDGSCRITLLLRGPSPSALLLNLVHGTQPELDRRVRLTPMGSSYSGHCGAVPSGHWHLELADDAGRWSVRQDVSGSLDSTSIAAPPNGRPSGGR